MSEIFSDLFPEQGRLFLTGKGKDFIERIGVDAVRQIVLGVMMGENVRFQTEPLTRFRITQVSAALVVMFLRGGLQTDQFTDDLSEMALAALLSPPKGRRKESVLPAQWVLGLTEKQVQNVLRDDKEQLRQYASAFDHVLEQAAERCAADYGDIRMTLGFVSDAEGRTVELQWKDLLRLTTAIGSQTLAIRGSDKSMYGKLFEKLILGSALTALGFRRVNRQGLSETEKVFWLSDSTAGRESDASLLYRLGKVAVFDIGFIGRGNSEISKDKLSRYEREAEIAGGRHSQVTFIIVDRLPARSVKTQEAAERIEAELIQMHWQYWPRLLAQKLGERLGFEHEIQRMSDSEVRAYLTAAMETMPIEDFLSAVVVDELQAERSQEPLDEGLEELFDGLNDAETDDAHG